MKLYNSSLQGKLNNTLMYRSCYNRTPPIIKLAFNWITMRLHGAHVSALYMDLRRRFFFDPLLIQPSCLSHKFFVARNSSCSLLTLFIFTKSYNIYIRCIKSIKCYWLIVENFFRYLSFSFTIFTRFFFCCKYLYLYRNRYRTYVIEF